MFGRTQLLDDLDNGNGRAGHTPAWGLVHTHPYWGCGVTWTLCLGFTKWKDLHVTFLGGYRTQVLLFYTSLWEQNGASKFVLVSIYSSVRNLSRFLSFESKYVCWDRRVVLLGGVRWRSRRIFPTSPPTLLHCSIAFCFCEFLRIEALVQASHASRNLMAPRSKPNLLASACRLSSLQMCLSLDDVSVSSLILKVHSVFIVPCPGLERQPGTFNFPYLSALPLDNNGQCATTA